MTKKRHRYILIGLLLAVAAVLFPSHRKSGYTADVPDGINVSDGLYRDGVYEGEATGYQPGILVEIEIVGGVLDTVKIVEHSEIGRMFWQRPMDVIPDAIVEEQTTDVDVVGGATATSTGIMAAVENALSKAVI